MSSESSLLSETTVRQLEQLRSTALASGKSLFDLWAESAGGRICSPGESLAIFGKYFHYPVVDFSGLERLTIESGPPSFELFSLRESVLNECIVWANSGRPAIAVFSNPLALRTQSRIEAMLSKPVHWLLAHPNDVRELLGRFEDSLPALTGVDTRTEAGVPAEIPGGVNISLESLGQEGSPAVSLVNSTLYDAMKAGASDIHLEMDVRGLRIKYRLDGVLVVAGETNGLQLAEQVVSRVKVMSGLDIAERRIPQDGRFKARINGRDIDFRVSIMPSVFGEDAVIRILDKESLTGSMQELRLDALGFSPPVLAVIRQLTSIPYGMFLVTGPTGSGKTTTLYAALTEINRGFEKIITIEDPVEYQLPGVLQIPVNEKKGLTFARGLRSILRHDPDQIMIGEIRDTETAEIAVQSALTGHLVLTTVHANTAFDVVGRLMHMGIDPYALVSALSGVVAQRLVRLNCQDCKESLLPDGAQLQRSGISGDSAQMWNYMEGRGCPACRGTGYKGRKAIAEFLVIDDELRDLIISRAPLREMKSAALRRGTQSLRQAVLDLVAMGETTLLEANRVTSLQD